MSETLLDKWMKDEEFKQLMEEGDKQMAKSEAECETIRLKCQQCHKIVERRKHCPYTGIEHGRGWIYVCDCRGDMEVLPSDKLVDILVDTGKRLDDEGVPIGDRVLKMWTFPDDSALGPPTREERFPGLQWEYDVNGKKVWKGKEKDSE